MRSLFALTLTAASVVPMVAPHALEAVAQQPYYQNAGKNLSANLKVDALGGRVVTLSETLTEIIDCNSHGKLWDGAGCVAPGGSITIPDCTDGQVLTKRNGTLTCVAAPAGGDGSGTGNISLPVCAEGETISSNGNKLVCKTMPGLIKQIVYGKTSAIVETTSSTLKYTGLSATITPTSRSSKILVLINQTGIGHNNGSNNNAAGIYLLRNNEIIMDIDRSVGYMGTNTVYLGGASSSASFLDSPLTTSPVTYKTQFNQTGNSGTVFLNHNSTSTITLIEIAQGE